MRSIFSVLILLVAAGVRAENITVSAAISLRESLVTIGTAYGKQNADHLNFNFDASGKLAAQIKEGAPVDLFISADNEQMDKLGNAGKIISKSRRVIVENVLVLVVPKNEKNPPTSFADLLDAGNQRIAIGEPNTVPAGRYAMQVFKSLRMEKAIAPRLVMAESVRQVLAYVEQNEVRAGLVYKTDAKQGGDKVRVVAQADPRSHEKIEYPAAIVAGSQHRESAQKFLEYLLTRPAKQVLVTSGFSIPTTQPIP